MVANSWFSQLLANTLNISVLRPKVTETSALGAAFLAGINSGLLPNINSLHSVWSCERSFFPEKHRVSEMEDKYETWLSAVERTKGLFS